MNENFDSASAVDTANSGKSGYSFYTLTPWNHDVATSNTVSNGTLSLKQTTERYNYGIATLNPVTGAGKSWQHGYFEARLRFDPAKGDQVQGWPSLWMMSSKHLSSDANVGSFGELDIFEAYHDAGQDWGGSFIGTAHEWSNGDHGNYGNHMAAVSGVNWSDWNTYGLLWEPGHAAWYLNGKLVLEQRWSSNGLPLPNPMNYGTGMYEAIDTAGPMPLILGSGVGWTLEADFVRVWQR